MQTLGRESLERQMADSHNRDQGGKAVADRRRAALVLSVHFLIGQGLLESAQRLQLESGVSATRFPLADNIDFLSVLQQFSEFHEFKYGKRPKFYKVQNGEKTGAATTTTRLKKTPKKDRPKVADEEGDDAIEIQGTSFGDNHHHFPAEKLVKPLPIMDEEQKALAAIITKDIFVNRTAAVAWDEIAELSSAKTLLREAIIFPITFPDLFTGFLSPWKGILLHGPPGVGKTLLAKAVASESKTTFFNVSVSSLTSKWRGDSEKLVRTLFDVARHHAPSTIFIDEIDSILGSRGAQSEHEASRRMKTELLIQMDGLATSPAHVVVLAATNIPWDLDFAILRRLEKRVLIPLPNRQARLQIIQSCLKSRAAFNADRFAAATEGFSGADLKALCKEAAMRPIRKFLAEMRPGKEMKAIVTDEDMEAAMASCRPTTANFAVYEKWQKEHGSDISN